MKVLEWIEDCAASLEAIGEDRPPQPRWNQDWFPRLDAAAAYAIVRKTKPRRIVEVGSGHSTRFLARAIADGALATRITCIDPEPRATIAGLDVDYLRSPVQSAPLGVFDLHGGDILFIDSSHQVKPGSDLDFLLNRVLPRLPRGVRVHFHDIFLPDPYPPMWAWRRYNEQDALARLLEDGYAPEFSSHQAKKAGLNGVLARLPLPPGALESSFWVCKR
ncbi:MAG TPA: class I SAM-dependent methyltransferase [Burkholderiales bacterium]|nr:class I SAM-dependent methyltransferase [Burkholderiales bacterium]